ncbi:hypothetical protein [Deinococcus sp.]|uniref:hypothetical protein n=1 Tax=Deinococcus sp. TaxID=47478 RepID=UPI0025C4BFB7|nr:hypothetical protein [Deinococcus sp.]
MDLLLPFAHTQATGLFVLTTLLPAAYWLLRVFREAEQRHVPAVAWWAAPGWVTLLFAGILAQPTFFALGAAALLLAEFWPAAYKPAALRPPALWAAFGTVLGLALLLVTLLQWLATPEPVALAAGLAASLAGLAGLLSSLGWRPEAARPQQAQHWARLARVSVPERPDLSLTLTNNGAQLRAELQNVSQHTLQLAGWSPVRINPVNAWLPFKNSAGQRVNTLRMGESTFLPLDEYDRGLRVWYVWADHQDQPLLFRADWQPPQRDRVLN